MGKREKVRRLFILLGGGLLIFVDWLRVYGTFLRVGNGFGGWGYGSGYVEVLVVFLSLSFRDGDR